MSPTIQIIAIAFSFLAVFINAQGPYLENCFFVNSTTMNVTLGSGPNTTATNCTLQYNDGQISNFQLPAYPQAQSWLLNASYSSSDPVGSIECDIFPETEFMCGSPPSVDITCNFINGNMVNIELNAYGHVDDCYIQSGSTEQSVVFTPSTTTTDSSDSTDASDPYDVTTATLNITTSNTQNGVLQCTYFSQNFSCTQSPTTKQATLFIPSRLFIFGLFIASLIFTLY